MCRARTADSDKPEQMPFRPSVLALALIALAAVLAGCGGSDASAPEPGASVQLHPVAGGFQPSDVQLADCRTAPDPARCVQQAYGNIAYAQGPRAALRELAADMAANPDVERGCHPIAHTIGSAALARQKGDIGRTFAAGDSTCWSGYYHGILERALLDADSDALLRAKVRSVCAGVLRDEPRFISYQCVHGLGHGLMINTGLDLPRSLRQCEGLATEWEQISCDGGVFMENFNTSYGVTSRYVRDDDLLYPCNAIAKRHKLYCYLQITDRLLGQTGYDWQQAARLCAGAERAWRGTCFQSYGRSASGTARLDRQTLLQYCGVPAPRWRAECVYGAVRDIASNDAGAPRAVAFCRAVETRLQARCFYGLGTILAGMYREPAGLARACTHVPTRFRAECRLERVAE